MYKKLSSTFTFDLCWPLQYLDRVCQKDQQLCQPYHGQLVKLYAEFAPKKLLPFLKSSIHYPLQGAMDECQVRGLIPEQVYLLGESDSF